MPQRLLDPSPAPQPLPQRTPHLDLGPIEVSAGSHPSKKPLRVLLAETGTTALVVVHAGRIVYESYPNGGSRERQNRCFSVTKSIASILVGMAIAEGAIDSVSTPIGRWLPDLEDPEAAKLPLGHLLEMRSGIRFTEGLFPWRDEPQTYYADDLRRRVLRCRVTDPIGAFFHYNDWHPLLLTLILERSTGMPVTRFLQTRLWNPLGCEMGGSVMVDRPGEQGVEHLESGLTARAIDLAKFGQLCLQDGLFRGVRLLPSGWIGSTTSPIGVRSDPEWFSYYRDRRWGHFLSSGRIYYKSMWWGHRIDDAVHDFFAMGVLGQHIYVSPDTGVVIVRLSERFPPGMWWAPVFRQVAECVSSRRPG